MICPIDAYYIVYDAYCKEVGVNTLLNDHPLAKYFGVLLILASQNQHTMAALSAYAGLQIFRASRSAIIRNFSSALNECPLVPMVISCCLHPQSKASRHFTFLSDDVIAEAGLTWPAVQLGPHQLP